MEHPVVLDADCLPLVAIIADDDQRRQDERRESRALLERADWATRRMRMALTELTDLLANPRVAHEVGAVEQTMKQRTRRKRG